LSDWGFVAQILSLFLGLIALYASGKFLLLRKKIGRFRKLVDDIDDALQDGAISEEELERIVSDLRELLRPELAAKLKL
jgi:hypothetical protein